MNLKKVIREIPDFPKPGIVFRDITTLIAEPAALSSVISRMSDFCREQRATHLAAVESRGFIFAGAVAEKLKLPLVLIRKAGKLPAATVGESYDLEYGSATIEVHEDSLKAGDRVVIVDDLLATGGTARATVNLVEKLGATVVGLAFVIELSFLPGREKLKGYDILALVDYDSE
ncbi:MAG: adenine phosphoribosyltransferase [bacterium]